MAGDGGVGSRQRRSPRLCQYCAALRRAALLAGPPDEANGEDLAPIAQIPHDASWADRLADVLGG